MEDLKTESLTVAIALLPGFLSTQIRGFFAPSRSASAFGQFMEALAFSVGNYVLVATVLAVFGKSPETLLSSLPSTLYWLGSSSIVLGVASGWIVGNDLHYRAARRLGLTKRTGRVDVWQDVFSDVRGNWLLVHMADGRRAIGWAHYYSDEGRTPSIFLREASWVWGRRHAGIH